MHYNYFRDYEPGIGRYVESDPIGLNAGTGTYLYVDASPLTHRDTLGLEGGPVFNPGNNYNPAWIRSNNCYSYALNRSGDMAHPLFGGGGLQPGFGQGKPFKHVTCSDILSAAKRDGAIEPGSGGECGGSCPSGYYKIKLVITDRVVGNDYHWFRQDAGGTWSSKLGLGAARQHGQSCPGPFLDYSKDCGALCVK